MATLITGGTGFIGAEPTPSAEELAAIVREKIPRANIDFQVDEEIQALLDKMLKPIVDKRTVGMGLGPKYSLEEMVDDFLLELRENPQRYA